VRGVRRSRAVAWIRSRCVLKASRAGEYAEIDGMSPGNDNPARYGTFIDIDPTTGAALAGFERLQLNLQLRNYTAAAHKVGRPAVLWWRWWRREMPLVAEALSPAAVEARGAAPGDGRS
jgi:hypothetical protein